MSKRAGNEKLVKKEENSGLDENRRRRFLITFRITVDLSELSGILFHNLSPEHSVQIAGRKIVSDRFKDTRGD